MPSLREIRRKIKSVKSTEQITKAMKMVAAARMRKSQSAILAARPFATAMEDLVRGLAALEIQSDIAAGREVQVHSLFDERKTGKVGLILVSADKGLCGAFNSNLLKATIEWLRAKQGKKVFLSAVGRKGRDFAHRLRGFDFELLAEIVGVFPKIHFTHAELLGKTVLEAHRDKELESVSVIYNEFKSVAVQRLIAKQILPIPAFAPEERQGLAEYDFEPDRQVLLDALLPRFVKAQLYRILLESQAAELAARMNAMDAASKNAKELRHALNLNMNRQRQSIITKEIAELVGGAEALAA
jgi:F-type H+-transporting ATPase subunit gamma